MHVKLRSANVCRAGVVHFLLRRGCSIVVVGPVLAGVTHGTTGIRSTGGSGLSTRAVYGCVVSRSSGFSPCALSLCRGRTLGSLSQGEFFVIRSLEGTGLTMGNLIRIVFPRFGALFDGVCKSSTVTVLGACNAPGTVTETRIDRISTLLRNEYGYATRRLVTITGASINVSRPRCTFRLVSTVRRVRRVSHEVGDCSLRVGTCISRLYPGLLDVPNINCAATKLVTKRVHSVGHFRSTRDLVSCDKVSIAICRSNGCGTGGYVPSGGNSGCLQCTLFRISHVV